MIRAISCIVLLVAFLSHPLAAQTVGTAGGSGVIDRPVASQDPDAWSEPEKVPFSPNYAVAYQAGASTWLILTEKEPPVKAWMAAKDRAEARRVWCEKEQASFVAAEINAEGGVELYFLCPGNGKVNVEMVSTWNGLNSVEVTFSVRDATRVKGTLRGGEGSCDDGVYCEQTEDYTFDAPLEP